MKRQKMGIFTKFAQPFSKWWTQLRKEVLVIPMKDPLDPIMSVNDDILTIRTGFHNRRNTIALPWLIASVFLTYVWSDAIPDLDQQKEHAISMVDFLQNEKAQREEWLLEAKKENNAEDVKYYSGRVEDFSQLIKSYMVYVEKDGDPTIFTYLESQYLQGNLSSAVPMLLGFVFYLTSTLVFFGVVVIKPRDAEIYFDRHRGIVYTWRWGRIGAARFEDIGIKENMMGLSIFLQFENKKQGGFWPRAVWGIDADKLIFHKEEDLSYLLAQLLAFMENGKEAVITGESFQRKPARFFLFDDKKPKNFDQRLEQVLEASHNLVELYEKNVIKPLAM
ncbi:hypothetical protein [Vibrio campbellii]|uniref:DUF3137 domain-containing protein n=1 Tax=Vibrio campbellii TaxID=680 RepID=A0ABY5I9P6_9VIBR|nr:hypothetical protein [Vibrio campbellii]UTZ21889.1 hypothetical protein HB760_08160 [Vibrio campbellii]UTZ30699.1 hypothetical protein HB762_04430 [Vibrio campbellii]